MARTIKRLNDRLKSADLDQVIQRGDFGIWRDEFAWWRRIGVDPAPLIKLLEMASVQRMRYEEQLEESRKWPRDVRDARKALKDAAPLIAFLKTKTKVDDDGSPELLFGDLGEQVERAMQNYINNRPQVVPRGRPADLWLAQCVTLLAKQLMVGPFFGRATRPRGWVRQSEKNTITVIERLLKLAGHGDVVTREKIRHVIRRIRPFLRRERARSR